MKELMRLERDHDDSVVEIKQKKMLYLGSERYIPGHRMFYLDLNTGFIHEAEYKEINVEYGTGKKRRKIEVKQDCVYIQALNKKNAIRKFKKMAKS